MTSVESQVRSLPNRLNLINSRILNSLQSHFALWALIKAPLMLGMNLLDIDSDTLAVITSEEVIAINQDPLGVQGKLVAYYNVT